LILVTSNEISTNMWFEVYGTILLASLKLVLNKNFH